MEIAFFKVESITSFLLTCFLFSSRKELRLGSLGLTVSYMIRMDNYLFVNELIKYARYFYELSI
jgi:hypothetical protein